MPPFTPPTLAVGEYVLRPFRSTDAAAWYAYLADPRVTEHTSWPPITSELVTTVVAKIIADYDEPKSLRWALARTQDDEAIGSCGFTRWQREQRVAELVYDLAPAYWGLGLMSAAVRAAMAWAFGPGSFSRAEAFVMTTNERSIALLERTGFRRERMLGGHRLARGVPRDFYLYSVVCRSCDVRHGLVRSDL
ncbi:MAG TPA: GNAT family protein [Gammaproteobacteria bacterium]